MRDIREDLLEALGPVPDKALVRHLIDVFDKRVVLGPDIVTVPDANARYGFTCAVPLFDSNGESIGKTAMTHPVGGKPPMIVSVNGITYAFDRITGKYLEATLATAARVVFNG